MVMIRLVVTIAILMLGTRIAGSEAPSFGNSSTLAPFQSACQALLGRLSGLVLERLGGTFLFSPQADGGGDGGGDGTGTGTGGTGGGTGGTGGGTGGTGGGTGGTGGGTGGTGDGTGGTGDGAGGAGTSSDGSTGADSGTGNGSSDSNSNGPSADPGAVGAPADQGDPGNTNDAPANAPSTVGVTSPSDPSDIGAPAQSDPTTDPANVSSVANPNDVPTDDPGLGLHGPGSSGGSVVSNGDAFGSAGQILPVALSGADPGGTVDVGINAVIVSGAPTPCEAIGKGLGVRNVTVTGGIIALGETPLAKPSSPVTIGAADHPPVWLKLKPDLRYLNGSLFPPIVPNVIDIRIISFTEQVIENSAN